jgi:hypothetical protein
MSARPLGLFAALALSPAAHAEEPTITLAYEPHRTAAGWDLKIFATNTGPAVVMVDDNPTVETAVVETTAGSTVALVTQPDVEMISRAGPRRKWMAVQPGERLLVGTSTVATPVETVIQDGTMVLTVRLVTQGGWAERVDKVPLAQPGS